MRNAGRVLIALVLALMLGIGVAACGQTAKDLGIPTYDPSDVVSEAAGSTILKTPDSVDDVYKFYDDWVQKEDWDVVSRTSTGSAANLTIKKSGDGATIAISTTGSDTLISISTYPSP